MAHDDFPTASHNSGERSDIVHMIYDTALDNSHLPDLIQMVYHEFEAIDTGTPAGRVAMDDLQAHFARGLQLSEQLVNLQERSALQTKVLDSMAVSVQLFQTDGRPIMGVGAPTLSEEAIGAQVRDLERLRTDYRSQAPMLASESIGVDQRLSILLGPDEIARMDLPQRVGWAIVRLELDPEEMVAKVAAARDLPKSRKRLLISYLRYANLRSAAEDAGVTYETARTYMKDICDSLGVAGQNELIRSILLNPAGFLRSSEPVENGEPVRNTMIGSDDTVLEYFSLGAAGAYPIIHIDAMSGGVLDVLAYPERYLPVLNRLNARLIIPCRPGTFRSTFQRRDRAEDFAEDIRLICDRLDLDRFSLFAYSHGCPVALGIAHAMQDRVDRVVLASVCNPDYDAPDWRSMDFFYQSSRVIGQRWPGLIRRVVPFMVKSILQNIDNYADRSAARATCAHERALLLDPEMRTRSRAMLEERTANGMDGMIQDYRIVARRLGFDLGRLDVPLLLFHGDCDKVNPIAGAEALANATPNSRFFRLPQMGHAFPFAEWDWLLAASAGARFEIPAPSQRGILTASRDL